MLTERNLAHRPKVLLIQRIAPHYRVPLFRALSEMPSFDISFAFDERARSNASDKETLGSVVSIPVVPVRNISFGRREAITFQSGVMAALSAQSYDVVIAEFNPRIVSNVLACLRMHRRTRFIWWGHGIGAESGALVGRLRLLLTSFADGVIFYDRARAERLMSLGLPEAKVYVAANSVETEEIAKLRSAGDWGVRRNVMFIGRLSRRKKVDILLRAYAHARSSLPEHCRLLIIGDGPERAALVNLAVDLGIADCVQFTGTVHRQDELAIYFNSALASVCLGAVGLGAIHSLAFGVPMVAVCDAGHGPEFSTLQNERTALLLETADVGQVARAILRLTTDKIGWTRMSNEATQLIDGTYGTAAMCRVFEHAILGTR